MTRTEGLLLLIWVNLFMIACWTGATFFRLVDIDNHVKELIQIERMK